MLVKEVRVQGWGESGCWGSSGVQEVRGLRNSFSEKEVSSPGAWWGGVSTELPLSDEGRSGHICGLTTSQSSSSDREELG